VSDAFLCRSEQKYKEECSAGDFSSAPAAIFFVSFLIFGVGTSVYYTLGLSYLDDNVRKNKTPFLLGKRDHVLKYLAEMSKSFHFRISYTLVLLLE
jgi:hypothetical protein